MMARAGYLLLSAMLAILSTAASSQQGNGATIVAQRQDGFKQIGRSFKRVNDLTRQGAARPQVLAAIADLGRAASGMAHWFPRGSGPAAGVRTAAKPAIWSDPAGFRGAMANFSTALRRLEGTVRTAPAEQWGDQARAVAATCAACHSRFREKS